MKDNQQMKDAITTKSLAILAACDYDVEATLRHYPEQAAALRPTLEMAALTATYYAEVPDPPGGLAAGRAWVLETAARQRAMGRGERRESPPRRLWPFPALRLNWAGKLVGAVMALLLILVPVGGQVARASARSVPGHMLYPLKRAAENLYYANVQKPEARVTLALSFSAERVAEIERLMLEERAIPAGTAGEIHELTHAVLQSAAWVSEAALLSLLEYVVWEAQVNVQALEALKETASRQDYDRLRQVQQVYLYQYLMARVALDHPDKFREAYQTGRPELMAIPMNDPLQRRSGSDVWNEWLEQEGVSILEDTFGD